MLAATLVAMLGLMLLAGLLHLPVPGVPGGPVHGHVAASYVAGGVEAGGAANLTTAVLLNYRGLDTFGEVVVIFSALIAVLATCAVGAGPTSLRRQASVPPPSPVVRFVVRLMAPFMAVFALFVMVHGDVLPGGGFQGGAVLGAMFILLTVALGRDRVQDMIPGSILAWLRLAAPFAFIAVALIGMAMTGWLFGLPGGSTLRHGLMILLEIGIGIGGAAVITGIFIALSGKEH